MKMFYFFGQTSIFPILSKISIRWPDVFETSNHGLSSKKADIQEFDRKLMEDSNIFFLLQTKEISSHAFNFSVYK